MLTRRTTLKTLAASVAALGAPAAFANEFYKMATLGPGSSPYMVMSTFARLVEERLGDVTFQVNATGAATQHGLQAGAGQLDFFMMAPIVHNLMLSGEGMFAEIPQAPEMAKNLRSLFIFPLGYYHIVTWADSGIETLDDVAGKTVFLGPPGGSAARTMEAIIEGATGLKADTDYTAVRIGWDAATQAFQDGRIDVYANPTLPPSPVIQQLSISRPVRLLGMSEEQMATDGVQAMTNRAGGTIATIPAGTYGDAVVNDADVTTVGSYAGIGTNASLPEEQIYRIVKAFWEGVQETQSSTPWLRNVTLEGAFHDLNMPLHPGAIRYYEEIGLTIPDAVRPPA